MYRIQVCVLIAALIANSAAAQTIDSFNPLPEVAPAAIAIDGNGKILIGGNFLQVGTTTATRVARLDMDGTLDPSFIDPNVDGEVKTVSPLPDGKILIGGDFAHVGGQSRNGLARLNDDGSLDTSFVDPGLDSTVWAIAVQPDGKILVGGDFMHIGATAQNYFARLDANGNLDTSFPTQQLCCNVVRAVALQADGHILVGGYFTQVDGVDHSYLARFSASGVFDPTFPNLPESIVILATDIVVGPDGKILLPGTGSPTMRRLNADGTLDASFIGAEADSSLNTISLQPNGKIIIGGVFTEVSGAPHHALARLNTDGSIDNSFGDLNFSVDAGNPNGYLFGIATYADGRTVVSGNFSLAAGQSRQFMARVVTGDFATRELVVTPDSSGITAAWYRLGDGPELAQAPTLMHSTDGVNFSAVGPMARVSNGWSAIAPYDVHGAPFFLRAVGVTNGGEDNGSPGQVASETYSNDSIFFGGFE